MKEAIRVQGRDLSASDLAYIREQISTHPEWHRTRLSRELCAAWDWTDEAGRRKDMACRTMLLKLERRGLFSASTATEAQHQSFPQQILSAGSP